jgi:conjugal transfer ATP-binding protein TraC
VASITPKLKTRKASELVNLESYTAESKLVIARPQKEKPTVGAVYRMTPLAGGGGEFSTVIQNAFKSLPENSIIQSSLIVYPDYDAPERFVRGKVHGGPVVQMLIGEKKRLIERALLDPLTDLPRVNRAEVVIALAVPSRRVDETAIQSGENFQNEFLMDLRNSGFHDAVRLSEKQLVGVYRRWADIYSRLPDEVELDHLLDLKEQMYGPDQIMDFRGEIGSFGNDTHCAVLTCKSMPVNPFNGLMNLAAGAPFNKGTTLEGGGARHNGAFILSTTIRVARQRREWTRVDSGIKSRTTAQNIPLKLGVEDSEAKLTDLQYMKKRGAEDGNRFVHVSMHAFMYGRTEQEAREAASTMKGTLDKLEFDARLVQSEGLARWVQSLPLNYSSSIAEKLECEAISTAADIGPLMPVFGDFLGNVPPNSGRTGYMYFTRRGRPHQFDPFNSDGNFCGTLCAESGAGKSVSLQDQILCDLADGRDVVLFDNGGSSQKFCILVGGEYNEFGKGSFMPSMNPFSNLTDDEFEEQQEGITDLVVMMAYGEEKVDSGARIAVNEAVKAAWGKRGDEAEIATVIDSLKGIVENSHNDPIKNQVIVAASNVIPRLKAFIDSPTRGVYFKGRATLDATKQFTVFELGSLEGDVHLKRCVLFCCMNTLMTRVKRRKGIQKRFWVDEALDLFKVESAGAAMEGLYLKARKEKLSVWIIVQSLLALSRFAAGKVILRQSAWKMIMHQLPEEIDTVFEEKVMTSFSNDPYFAKILRDVESKKYFWSETQIIGHKTYEVARLYLDPLSATVFSSEGDARDKVVQMIEQGVDVLTAIRRVMDDKKRWRHDATAEFVKMLRDLQALSDNDIRACLEEVLTTTNA